MLEESRCAHQEYIAAEICRFANLPIRTYFDGMEGDLAKLAQLTGISHKTLQNMTYMQAAREIDDKLNSISPCGNRHLHEAIEILAAPLVQLYNGQAEHEEKARLVPITNAVQRISLDQRLANKITLADCIMLNMEINGFLLFMDELAGSGRHFETIYLQYFQEYGSQSFISLIAESVQMPTEQREKIQYNLLIHPFARLDMGRENP